MSLRNAHPTNSFELTHFIRDRLSTYTKSEPEQKRCGALPRGHRAARMQGAHICSPPAAAHTRGMAAGNRPRMAGFAAKAGQIMTISSVRAAYGDQLSLYRQQLEQQQETGRTGEQQQQRQAQATPQQGQTDSAHFSAEARLLAEARNAAATAPDVREDKVAALRAQVQDGTCKPNSATIARNLLQEDMAVFGA